MYSEFCAQEIIVLSYQAVVSIPGEFCVQHGFFVHDKQQYLAKLLKAVNLSMVN